MKEKSMTNSYDYDVLIVGAGAAGLTAAIYAVRYNLKTAVVSFDFGGQILETGEIENWPGIKSILGRDLSASFEDHARSLGTVLLQGTVKKITKEDRYFKVEVDGVDAPSVIKAKSVILTTGAKHRKLGIKGEKELVGRGVSYCATCDAAFFKDKVVAIVGGGDAAITGAIDVANHASKVFIIHRRLELKAKPAYVDMARENGKIEFIMDTNVVEAKGSTKLEVIVLDKPYKGSDTLAVDGLFVEIGFLPETTLARELGLEFDEKGYVKVNSDQSTNIPGLLAAGDLTNASNRFAQLVTAAAEGAVAAEAAYKYLAGL